MDLNQLGSYIPQIQTELDQREQRAREEEELRLKQQQELQRQQQAAAALKQRQVQPVDQQVMAYNAQMESGRNPAMGYHDQTKSSAYGTYGLTAPAYQDVQRANPAFANRPIESLTPEEQQQAAATFQQEQARQLQALGIEPTPANLRLSHLMGATGAKNFLGTGAISPAAAAANGGEAQLRNMAIQRMNGQTGAPTATNAPPMIAGGTVVSDAYPTPTEQAIAQQTGATQTTTTGGQQLNAGWSQRLSAAMSDPAMRDQLRRSPDTPPEIRKQLAEIEYEDLRRQVESEKIDRRIKQQVEQGDFKGLLAEAKKQSDDASPWRVAFYTMIGANDLAKQEQIKLGAGQTYQPVTLKDGKEGIALVGADGLPKRGFTQFGPMTPDELAQAAGMSGGKADYVGGSVINDKTGLIGRLVSRNNRTMVESNGRYYPATAEWRNNTPGTDLNLATQKAGIELRSRLAGMSSQARLNAFAETNQALANNNLPLLSLQQMGLDNTGNFISGAPAAPATQQSMPQQGVPQQGVPVAGGVPQPGFQPQQGVPQQGVGVAPVAPAAVAQPQLGMTPQGMPDQVTLKVQEEARKDIVKKAAEVEADAGNITRLIKRYDTNIKDLEAERTNFGELFSEGVLPGERFVGKKLGTRDNANTQRILNDIKDTQAKMAKLLGVNPTDRDLQFILENDPNETWTNRDVADWFKRAQKASKSSLEIARKQLDSGGTYREPIPQDDSGEVVRITNDAAGRQAYDALPRGSRFITPDGQERIKK